MLIDYAPAMVETKSGAPAFEAAVLRARRTLAGVDPLGLLLLGDARPGLGAAGLDAYQADRRRLAALASDLESVSVMDGAVDVDRRALQFGLRRGAPPDGPRSPAGAAMLERHLLARIAPLGAAPGTGLEDLAGVLEDAPRFLVESRQGTNGGAEAAGHVALAAAKRMPAILNVVADAARVLPVPAALRQRVEAALGLALSAAAEESGWLLKEYLVEAASSVDQRSLGERLEDLGFGARVDELEAAAEELLANQAVAREGEAPAAAEGAERLWDVDEASARWRQVDAELRAWCPLPDRTEVMVEATPPWLRRLVPPVALVNPGPLSKAPYRLLVSADVPATDGDFDSTLRAAWAADLAPAAWQRASTPVARLLLPAGDLVEAWRVIARTAAPGLAGWRPADAGRELSWRAMLALVAAGMIRGRLGEDEAADLLRAETGMDDDTARLQAVHVAAQPLAALTFIAGRRRLARLEHSLGDAGAPEDRVRLLSWGPVPAAALDL